MLIRWASERWRKQFFAIILIALSCAFFFLRINNISIHPLFVDEAISVHISERIAETSPFVDAWQGRLFSVWALFPFQSHLAASAFIPRAITVLAQLPALLALVVLAKRKAGDWAALLAFLFFLFSPYHIFFNRIALPDAICLCLPAPGNRLILALAPPSPSIQRACNRHNALPGVWGKNQQRDLFCHPLCGVAITETSPQDAAPILAVAAAGDAYGDPPHHCARHLPFLCSVRISYRRSMYIVVLLPASQSLVISKMPKTVSTCSANT